MEKREQECLPRELTMNPVRGSLGPSSSPVTITCHSNPVRAASLPSFYG